MSKPDNEEIHYYLTEIMESERVKAGKILKSQVLLDWLKAFRKKYIVNGFLMPFYAKDGRYSHPRLRVSKFGDYILPWKTQGKIFHEVPPGWIRNEDTWFWLYLTGGQEIIISRIPIPDILKIDGIPSQLIWQDVVAIMKGLHLFGEDGGGLVLAPHSASESYLAGVEQQTDRLEGEYGYLESYKPTQTQRWVRLFHTFESYQLSSQDIEIRPAWFHLASYAFFNTPIQRLPVFSGAFTEEGKLEALRFLDDSLSDVARSHIGKALLDMPTRLKQQANIEALRRERQEMVWWLWRNVGHEDEKRTLSYREVADIAGNPRSSIQTAVERFDRMLENNMDRHLLGRLLRTAGSIGLGYNLTYKTLAQRGLVPTRERQIDSFDDLDKLI
jgi:hypothetical protein